MRILPVLSFLLLVLCAASLQAQHAKIKPPVNAPNRIEHAAVKSSLQQTSLSLEIPAGGNPGHTTTMAVHEPMPFITTEEARAIKAEKLLHKRYDSNYHGSSNTSRVTPVIDARFEANVSVDETPSSNAIAISDDGIIISANSDGIIYFTENGERLFEANWSGFFNDNQLSSSFFSPRVIYDTEEERFILVTLHGKSPATSRVIISFSKSDNPIDGWNVYKLPGNPLGDGSWFDFPSIGISTNEVYVSGNLIEGTTFKKAVVYQINKTDGYVAAILDWQFWTDFFNGPVSITPASYGQRGDYGPGIYLISSAAAGDDDYWFWDLDADIGGDPEFIGYIVPTDAYSPPADASQLGTSDKLETGDARTTNAFYLDGMIHFVHNVDVGGGFSGISYGRFSVPQQTVTTSRFGESGAADIAHAGLASFANNASGRSVTISFLRSGASLYPEFRVVNVDQGMSWSSATLVNGGETYVDREGSVESWGQYTGIARRHNSADPRTWSAGSVGGNVSGQLDHTYKTWIGEVTDGSMVSTHQIEKGVSCSISPNPVKEVLQITFSLSTATPVTIGMYNLEGKRISVLFEGTLQADVHQFSFPIGDIETGDYVISISDAQRVIASDQVIVIR